MHCTYVGILHLHAYESGSGGGPGVWNISVRACAQVGMWRLFLNAFM